MKVKKINTNISEKGLGIFNNLFNWLHKLQIIFAKTKEHMINRKNSLKLQKITEIKIITNNLKKRELFNFVLNYYFSEYPKPFDFA